MTDKKQIQFDPQRNEVLLPVNGNPRVMRATWKAMAAIEQEAGMALVPLLDKFEKGNFGYSDTLMVLYHGLEANKDYRLDREELGELLERDGVSFYAPYAVMLLAVAFHGGKNVGKKFEVQQQKLLDELSAQTSSSS